jgi:hypothetical protein
MIFKTLIDFFRMILSKFLKDLPEVDPTIKPSFENIACVSTSSVALGCQEGIKDAVKQMFLHSADEEFLLAHGAKDGVERLNATSSEGYISVNGIVDTEVPESTEVIWNGYSYLTSSTEYVEEYTDTINLTLSGGIVTVITDTAHSLATGLEVVISGATQTVYNGTFIIEVIDENTFTYELDEEGLTADTGSYTSNYVLLYITSVLSGVNKNIDPGTAVSISVDGLEPIGNVGVDGVTGGYDIEDIEDYRIRALDARIAPRGENIPQQIISARKITGITRVVVFRPVLNAYSGSRGYAGYLPRPNETVIYPFQDDAVDIIPSTEICAQIKQQIIDDGGWSSKNSIDGLMVLPAIKYNFAIEVSNLLPNTVTMQNSFLPQLKLFFRDNFKMKKADDSLSGIVTLDELKTAIRNIKDDTTGEIVTDFDIDIVADYTAEWGVVVTVEEGDITFV